MTRFDFDKITRDAFNAAVSLGIIDAVELGCLMAQHRTDAQAIIDEITEAAFCDHHSAEGFQRHSRWCDIIDSRAAAARAA